MAKRRATRPINTTEHATSPPLDVESNPTLGTRPTVKPQPKPRPKPAKNSTTPPVPDAVDHPLGPVPLKRGRSKSNADGTVPTSTDQPPAKKKKGSNGT